MTKSPWSGTIEEPNVSILERTEDVFHPLKVWTDPEYANQSLVDLTQYYVDYLKGRSHPASIETIIKYRKSLISLLRSLEANGDKQILGSLTPHNVNLWVKHQRERGLSEDGIASRLSAVKAFSNTYVYRHLELTTCDLLDRVARIIPPAKPFAKLTDMEQEQILNCFDRLTYEDVRNRALIACYLATGRRLSEILNLRLPDLNQISGEIVVKAKGGDLQIAVLSPKALQLVKRYLRERPKEVPTQRLWLTEEGTPLTYWGVQSIFRRLKKRSGIGDKLHCHLLRHHFAQTALEKGAERAALQDMLGHKSDAMSRRYAGAVRQQTAAKMMPKFAPI